MKIQVRTTSDWSALYIDGVKSIDGHTLHWSHVLDALGIEYDSQEIELPPDFRDYTHYIDFTDKVEDINVGKYEE